MRRTPPSQQAPTQVVPCSIVRALARWLQVHKFSKFIHGTSVLLPDMVQAVPYWIDDESIRKSIIQSAREQCVSWPIRAHAVHSLPNAACATSLLCMHRAIMGLSVQSSLWSLAIEI